MKTSGSNNAKTSVRAVKDKYEKINMNTRWKAQCSEWKGDESLKGVSVKLIKEKLFANSKEKLFANSKETLSPNTDSSNSKSLKTIKIVPQQQNVMSPEDRRKNLVQHKDTSGWRRPEKEFTQAMELRGISNEDDLHSQIFQEKEIKVEGKAKYILGEREAKYKIQGKDEYKIPAEGEAAKDSKDPDAPTQRTNMVRKFEALRHWGKEHRPDVDPVEALEEWKVKGDEWLYGSSSETDTLSALKQRGMKYEGVNVKNVDKSQLVKWKRDNGLLFLPPPEFRDMAFPTDFENFLADSDDTIQKFEENVLNYAKEIFKRRMVKHSKLTEKDIPEKIGFLAEKIIDGYINDNVNQYSRHIKNFLDGKYYEYKDGYKVSRMDAIIKEAVFAIFLLRNSGEKPFSKDDYRSGAKKMFQAGGAMDKVIRDFVRKDNYYKEELRKRIRIELKIDEGNTALTRSVKQYLNEYFNSFLVEKVSYLRPFYKEKKNMLSPRGLSAPESEIQNEIRTHWGEAFGKIFNKKRFMEIHKQQLFDDMKLNLDKKKNVLFDHLFKHLGGVPQGKRIKKDIYRKTVSNFVSEYIRSETKADVIGRAISNSNQNLEQFDQVLSAIKEKFETKTVETGVIDYYEKNKNNFFRKYEGLARAADRRRDLNDNYSTKTDGGFQRLFP